ncbi:hypothetical protein [Chitinibacter sp. S2-10]|uniref:hypothetical protein n=1 Tax=Chitinibacter sp. S2-10 TaxID=3373597 RepID=UPI0039779669
MKKTLITLLLSIGVFSGFVQADGVMSAKHGGVMAEATSGTRAELSTAGNMLMVYLTSHQDEAIASKDYSAEITLLNGSEKQVLKLMPSGDNSLMASGQYKAVAGTKALLKLIPKGKPVEQFRFVLK